MTFTDGNSELEPQERLNSGPDAQDENSAEPPINTATSISTNDHAQPEISDQELGLSLQQHLAEDQSTTILEEDSSFLNDHAIPENMDHQIPIGVHNFEDNPAVYDAASAATPQLPRNELEHPYTAPHPQSSSFNDIAKDQGTDEPATAQQYNEASEHTTGDTFLFQPNSAERQILLENSEVVRGNPYAFAASLAAPFLEPIEMIPQEQTLVAAIRDQQALDAPINHISGSTSQKTKTQGRPAADDLSHGPLNDLVFHDHIHLADQSFGDQEEQDQCMEDATPSHQDIEEEDGDRNDDDGDDYHYNGEEDDDEEDQRAIPRGRTHSHHLGNDIRALLRSAQRLDDEDDMWETQQPGNGGNLTYYPIEQTRGFGDFGDGRQSVQHQGYGYDPRTPAVPSPYMWDARQQANQLAQRQYHRSMPHAMASLPLSIPSQSLHPLGPLSGYPQHSTYGNVGMNMYPTGHPPQQYGQVPSNAPTNIHPGHGYQMQHTSIKGAPAQTFMPRVQPTSGHAHKHRQKSARTVDEHDCGEEDDEPLQARTRRHASDQSDSHIASSPPPARITGSRKAPPQCRYSDVEYITSQPKSKVTFTRPAVQKASSTQKAALLPRTHPQSVPLPSTNPNVLPKFQVNPNEPAMQKARITQKAAPLPRPLPQSVPLPSPTRSESSSSIHSIDWTLPGFEASYEAGATKHDLAVAKVSVPNLIREDLLLSPDHAAQEYHLLLNNFMPAQQALSVPDPAPAQALLNFHTIAVMVIEAFVQYEIGDEMGLGRGHWHNAHDQGDKEYERQRDAKDSDPDEIFFAVIDRWRAGMESNKKPLMLIRGAQEFCDVALDLIYYVKENGLLKKEKKPRADKAVKRGAKGHEEKEEVQEIKGKSKGKAKAKADVKEQPAKANKGVKRGATVTRLQSQKKTKVEQPKAKVGSRKKTEPQITIIKRSK